MPNMLTYTRESLVAAWLLALFFGFLEYRNWRKQADLQTKDRVMIAMLYGIGVGAAFSVMAAVQRGADRGLVPQDLKWFVIAMILLLMATYAFSVFLLRRLLTTKN
jgi:phosphatidylglycerophosphate synthase